MEEKNYFYKLLLEGHFDLCFDECALKEFSKMSVAELIEKTTNMSSVEMRDIICKHEECLKNYRHKYAS
ncbi:hypothetical protein SAMN05444274_106298 [Mariniphaga anaerophila]|uniref:Uncharacterized protein n=1 Tax=Mariniphaga anaerophila TaxID=1484053 RepID=A0A1M5CWP9_9BACT|nr:hypothetical protein [Mariniphaga anaerophila]SHF59125.1 hypothetical protein SAMN05444274_106298 [Mariniphaga anaerophila]